jgi:hypothetical protein
MCSGWTPKVVARATRAPASRSALETAAPPHFAVVAIGFVCHESTFFFNEREKKRSECQRSVDGAKRRESDPSSLGSASGPNDERRRGAVAAARTKKKIERENEKKNRARERKKKIETVWQFLAKSKPRTREDNLGRAKYRPPAGFPSGAPRGAPELLMPLFSHLARDANARGI